MNQHSEELRTKVREALIERLQAFSAKPTEVPAALQLADTLMDLGTCELLADVLSYDVAAAIEASHEADERERPDDPGGYRTYALTALRGEYAGQSHIDLDLRQLKGPAFRGWEING